MPNGDSTLNEEDRLKLDSIVSEMEQNSESEENVLFVVNDFKSKYASKKKDQIPPTITGDFPLESESLEPTDGSKDFDFVPPSIREGQKFEAINNDLVKSRSLDDYYIGELDKVKENISQISNIPFDESNPNTTKANLEQEYNNAEAQRKELQQTADQNAWNTYDLVMDRRKVMPKAVAVKEVNQRKLDNISDITIKKFQEDPIFQPEDTNSERNKETYLQALVKAGYNEKELYESVGEQYKPKFLESIEGSVKNIGTSLKGTIPTLNILTADIFEGVLGKDNAKSVYEFEGRDLDKVRSDAYSKLNELDKERLPTRGIVESYKSGDIAGGIAASVDAVGQIVSSVPSMFTGGIAGETIRSFNETKAKELGVTVEELYERGDNELETPLIIGGIATGLEGIGLVGIKNLIAGTLKGSTGKKVMSTLYEWNKEGGTELIQVGLEKFNESKAKGISNKESSKLAWDDMWSEKGLESYAMGVIGSAGASGIGKGTKKLLIKKKEIAELDTEVLKAREEGRVEDAEMFKDKTNEVSQEITEIEKEEAKSEVENIEKTIVKEEIEVLEEKLKRKDITPAGESVIQDKINDLTEKLKQDEKVTTEITDTEVTAESGQTPEVDKQDIVKTETKLETDAIQEPSTKEKVVRDEPEISKRVLSEDTKGKEVTEKGEKEEVKPKVSGIKKELVPEEVQAKIEAEVDWEKATDAEVHIAGEKAVKEGKLRPKDIVFEVKETPRALQPLEVSSMIYYKSTLDKELSDAYRDRAKLKEGQSTAGIDKTIANLEEDLFDYQSASLITAQQQSLAFRLRKGLRDSNSFDVVRAIDRYKKSNEGVIPKEIEEKFKEQGKKIQELDDKIKQLEEDAELKSQAQVFENIVEDVKKSKTPKKSYKQKAKKTANKFRAKYKRDLKFKIKIKDKDGKETDIDIDPVKNGISQNDIVELIAKAIETTGSIADALVQVKEQIQEKDWYKKLSKSNQDYLYRQISDEVLAVEKMVPYVENGKLIVPSVLVRDIVSSGVDNIGAVVDIIHNKVLEENPDITKREVRDAVSGYGKELGQTKDDLRTKINKIKRLGKLMSQEEDLKSGKKPLKYKIKDKAKISEEESQLRNNIKSLKDDLGIIQEEKLERTKRRLKKQTEELQTKIKTGDFSKKEVKKLIISDDELSKLRAEKEKALDIVQKEQFKIEESNRNLSEKVADGFAEIFNALPRVMVASMDLSAMGVQGFLRMWKDPVQSAKGLKESVHQLVSKERNEEYINKIKAEPWYHIMKESKLALLESNYKLDVKEEQFLGNWINLLYDGILNSIDNVVGKNKVTKFIKDINPYKASERAYAGYLNYIRVQMFLKLKDKMESQGITFQGNPQHYKSAANLVNNITGRGSLGPLESSNRLLQAGFFSARRLAATLNVLNPVYYANMPKEIRKEAAKEYITSLAIITGVTVAAAAAVGDNEDDFFDSNSSNFLKIKIKGEKGSFTTINLYGPLQSLAVTLSRIASGKFRSATTGKEEKLGWRFGKGINTRWDVLISYFANKKSPGITLIKKHLDVKAGLEESEADIWREATTPMWTHDLGELFESHPELLASFLTSLNMLGVATQHFELNKKQREEKRENTKRNKWWK